MSESVYIETTVPSYYHNGRPGLANDIARTREWWDEELEQYVCFVSTVVLDELREGDYPTRNACLELVRGLKVLEVTSAVVEVAQAYQESRLMPRPPSADALHVALATVHGTSFLLSWNCRHIVNVSKMDRLTELNRRLGYLTPRLVTPHMLRRAEDEP